MNMGDKIWVSMKDYPQHKFKAVFVIEKEDVISIAEVEGKLPSNVYSVNHTDFIIEPRA